MLLNLIANGGDFMRTKDAFDIVLDAATVFAVENETRSFHRLFKNSPEEVTGEELKEAIANVETYLDTYWGNNDE